MKTTIASQLVLVMLCEKLADIPDSQILMSNTDGCEIIIPREYESLYNQICKEWEQETKLTLEFGNYDKMWIADINNYGCISDQGKIKNKGRYEVDKVVGSEPAYHKDNSFRVVPLALQEYFTKGIPVEQTIMNHKNIYDFCGSQKFKGKDVGELHKIVCEYKADGSIAYNKLYVEPQQKNTRYYISKDGDTFVKHYGKDNSIEKIHVGYKVTIFNRYIEKDIKDYNLDYSFYIRECKKELLQIENSQLQLF